MELNCCLKALKIKEAVSYGMEHTKLYEAASEAEKTSLEELKEEILA